VCHDPQTVARRHLVVTPYETDGENKMVPQIPDTCPLGVKDGRPCRLFLDHWRSRKTGPCFPLNVFRCRTHEIAFTLYPPGYTPWGRKKWAPVAPDGTVVTCEEGASRFQDTYFEAALVAAEGIVWAREKEVEEDFRNPSFITQQCRLDRALRLLGLKGDRAWREAFAQTLSIPGQRLHEAAQTLTKWPSNLSALGRAVRDVLSEIPRFLGDLFERLAACGAAVGLWPPLHVWRPYLRQLQCRAFSHRRMVAEGMLT
jgi:hypothetical protein